MRDKLLIEVWYHKVMNEKSIPDPFVPDQQKFCCAAKAAGGRLTNGCGGEIVQLSKKTQERTEK